MDIIPNFIVYTKIHDNNYLHYNYETKEFNISFHLPININSFFLPKSYLKTKEIKKIKKIKDIEKRRELHTKYLYNTLPKYAKQLVTDVKDLYKLHGFNYFDNDYKFSNGNIFYRTHATNVVTFFKRYTKKELYENFEPVYYDEYKYWTKCYNSGLMYLKKKGIYNNCFGYDYKMFYGINMKKLNFHMATEKGEYAIIKEFPKSHYAKHGKANIKNPYMLPIQYGIYHVKIISNDPLLNTKFMFSKYHWYTSYSICQILKYIDKGKHGITLEIVQDGKANAYLYDDTKLVVGFDIFHKWANKLITIKENCKNSITKMLASSGWGHLQDVKTIYCNQDQFDTICDNGYTISANIDKEPDYFIHNFDMKGEDQIPMYELIDVSKPVYKLPLRLLPFITSYSRCRMASVIDYYNLEEHVIRIHTDGIVLDKECNFSDKDLIAEDKTTGNIEFKNVNDYDKI